MNDDTRKIVSMFKETWHKMDSLYDLYAKSVGLSFTTLIVLELLHNSSDVYTQKDVCERLGLPKQLVNSVMKHLWEQGYVELKEAKDRRNKDIIITDEGKKYIIGILKPLEDLELAAWESFSAEEIISYAKATEKYVKAFEDAMESTRDI